MISWLTSLSPFVFCSWKEYVLFPDWETDGGDLKPTYSLKQKYSTNQKLLTEGRKIAFSYIFEAIFLLWFLSIVIVTNKTHDDI